MIIRADPPFGGAHTNQGETAVKTTTIATRVPACSFFDLGRKDPDLTRLREEGADSALTGTSWPARSVDSRRSCGACPGGSTPLALGS